MMHTATTTDLTAQGFTTEQIERLEALRDAYPVLEFITTRAEWQRLTFLKWRYQHGQLRDADREAPTSVGDN